MCCSKDGCERALRTRKVEVICPNETFYSSTETLTTEDVNSPADTSPFTSTSQHHDYAGSPTEQQRRHLRNAFDDVEKGQCSQILHVAMNVSGMNCTSCSKKGLNVLNHMTGVTHATINFVAGTGEFDLDPRLDPMEVIFQFERQTGFKSSRIMKDLQTIEIVMPSSKAKELEDRLYPGIHVISRVHKEIYSVNYDPAVIGARSLLELIPSGKLAVPSNDSNLMSGRKNLFKIAWSTVLTAALTVPVVVLAWSRDSVSYPKRSVICFVLATCVQAIAVPEFYVGALKSLIFSKTIEVDMLVVISITAAYGYSVVAFALRHRGYILGQGEFFETSTLLVTLILLGRLVSAVARMKAFSAVSMNSLQAETALLIDKCGESRKVDKRLLEYGDIFLVPPYSRIVTDGEVCIGSSTVDESMITGESLPILKGTGDTVIAGTMNGSSPLTVRLIRLPGQNSISDIASLVENALGSKPRVQDLADKAAGWFIPVIVSISLIVFTLWIVIALKIRHKDVGGSFGLAMTYSIAVLAVSCPCAVGLAVPLVLIIAGGVAARSGIVIKSASATERAHRTTDVIFDKTGTLTTGILTVVEDEYYEPSPELVELKSLILGLIEDNEHPVSSAVATWLKSQAATDIHLTDMQSIPGAGLKATWNGKEVKAGNPYWLEVDTRPEMSRLTESGMTILAVTIDSKLVAVYGLTSTLRPEATAVIQNLHQRKVTCHIVSGDGHKAVQNVGQTLGINPTNTASLQNPSLKQTYVQTLISQRGKTVLFCGDGTNDAIAIAQAHIGVRIGSTSEITRATADVVLAGGLEGIPALLDISRQAFIRIVFNFVWSGVYNFFAILLAAGAFVKVRIPPAYAGIGEIVSILPVVLVTMTLMRFKRRGVGV